MGIYPKCVHLNVPMICCSLVGILPSEFMSVDNKYLQNAYSLYSKFMLGCRVIFLTSCYTKLYMILNTEGLKMDAISANLCITLINTVNFVRQLIMKWRPSFRSIVKEIIDNEKYILSLDDKKMVEIYKDCARQTNLNSKLYVVIIELTVLQYVIRPLFTEPFMQEVGNKTVIIKPLPLSIWVPFDDQIHYLTAYIWHSINTVIAGSSVTFTDIFMFSLIIYPSGQLRMLQHILRNFETYKQKCKTLNNVVDDDVAGYLAYIDIIDRHKKIIEFVNYFNNAMSGLMVVDFLQSSLQIAFILNQFSGNKITLSLLLMVATFFVGMLVRLYLFYYYANDLIILSEGLATAVWESNWYEQSKTMKYMMLIFMIETKNPLKLFIGPFGVISLDSFIAVLKATYSYITLMYGVN